MNWGNLKKNKCPKCNKVFIPDIIAKPNELLIYACRNCDFQISDVKYNQIVTSTVKDNLIPPKHEQAVD